MCVSQVRSKSSPSRPFLTETALRQARQHHNQPLSASLWWRRNKRVQGALYLWRRQQIRGGQSIKLGFILQSETGSSWLGRKTNNSDPVRRRARWESSHPGSHDITTMNMTQLEQSRPRNHQNLHSSRWQPSGHNQTFGLRLENRNFYRLIRRRCFKHQWCCWLWWWW